MRRNLNEVGAEILRRRDEFREKQAKRRKTAKLILGAAVPCCAAAVIMAVVLPGVLQRSMKNGIDADGAPDPAQQLTYGGGRRDGSTPGGINEEVPNAAESAQPGDSSAGAAYSGWYCGTPIVNDDPLDWRPGDAVPVNAVPDGGMLHWRFADTNNVIEIGKEQAAELFALLGELTPGEPYSEEDDKPVAFVFELFFGGKQLQAVGFEDGSYLLNGEGCYTAPRDTQRRLGELIERIEGGFFCTGG